MTSRSLVSDEAAAARWADLQAWWNLGRAHDERAVREERRNPFAPSRWIKLGDPVPEGWEASPTSKIGIGRSGQRYVLIECVVSK